MPQGALRVGPAAVGLADVLGSEQQNPAECCRPSSSNSVAQWKPFFPSKWAEGLDNSNTPVPGERAVLPWLVVGMLPKSTSASTWVTAGGLPWPLLCAQLMPPAPSSIPSSRLINTSRPHSAVHRDADQCCEHRRHPRQLRHRALLVSYSRSLQCAGAAPPWSVLLLL